MGACTNTLTGYGDPVQVGDIARMECWQDGQRTESALILITGIRPVGDTVDLSYERTENGRWVPGGCLLQTLIGRRTLKRLPRRGEVK